MRFPLRTIRSETEPSASFVRVEIGLVGIVSGGVGKLRQMAQAPGHGIAVSGEIPVMFLLRADDGSDTLRHTGLLRDHKSLKGDSSFRA